MTGSQHESRLPGLVALVTGGGVRIGRALALTLAGRGVNIALHYGSSRESAVETADLIRGLGVDVALFPADLRDACRAESLVPEAVGRFGRVDILVNSAAIFRTPTVEETTEQEWDDHLAINLTAPFFLSRAFARNLEKGRRGDIVSLADWRAVRPGPVYPAYTIAKAGLVAMTQSLAQALAPDIRVNAIAPGAILPPPGGDAAALAARAERIPLRQQGSPDEVARALLYLLEAEFVTGQILFVDGGEHLVTADRFHHTPGAPP